MHAGPCSPQLKEALVVALRRFAALVVLAFLATTPAGCIISTSSGVCINGVDQYGNPIKTCTLDADFAFSACTVCTTLTSDISGGLPGWTASCPSKGISEDLPPMCCGAPSSSVPVCFYYNDPLLVELPSTWLLQGGTWKSDGSPDSGSLVYVSAAGMATPAGGGPIHTDPGCNAYLLWMDHTPADGNVHFRGIFRSPASDTGCVKAMEVSYESWYGTPHALIPATTGQTFDFTQIPTNSPQSVCVGPYTTVSARPQTWGQVKTHYR
jgi:hypothetical protein